MLDMSKVFDTIQRVYLFYGLKEIIEKGELHLIHFLLDNVQIVVKLENQIDKLFHSQIGSPQGDAARALFFIIYLAVILSLAKQKINEIGLFLPDHSKDHNHLVTCSLIFTLDQQYAGDISCASTSTSAFKTIEEIVPAELKARNLLLNDSKTERYTVSRNSTDDW